MKKAKKQTVRTLRKMKADNVRIAMITAYDAPTARFAEAAGIDMILVGDSLGMASLGYSSTIPVTMDDMIRHSQAVRRGAPDTFVVVDMPFMSYHISPEQALTNAAKLIQETDGDCVKLEVDHTLIPTVRRLVDAGIPVCAHIGLLPQSVKSSGGYHVQGRSAEDAAALLADAKALQDAGAFCIVLECVPCQLAKQITEALEIPTIGIGAGADCDGQVQVLADTIGFFTEFIPKHAKRYADLGSAMTNALQEYVADVKNRTFPTEENSFN